MAEEDREAQLDEEEAAARAAGKPWDETDRHNRAQFLVYQLLGGRRSEAQYLVDLYRFYDYTCEVFTLGQAVVVTRPSGEELELYTNSAAADAFTEDYLDGDVAEWNRFFTSVDAVAAYT
jgi:hypothetical protein